ncbi:protodermal factor 1 [Perilla frutescens var. hirtella]|uniref:Protodermal factor 1 n=1 Tax=Perilla frutescens var. hirtella TaxID=608512 RepID=A0AAD4JN98_PERFH|nr:protodermal factor 1 [Perilla frutescens var. hirtella]
MERKRSNQQLALLWVAMAALLLSPSSVISSSLSFEDQKNFFYTTPPTTVLYTPPPPSPSYGSGGGHSTTPTPYHGDGGGTPPANCGGHPSMPHSPPLSVTPPTSSITMPSPPNYDPNSPPFSCTYWKKHPNLIWGLLGWWGTMGSAFGATNVPGLGANRNLVEALSNTRTDGFGDLYREGTAALLNSISHANFPYTTTQVKDRFLRALTSNKAAAAQARLFNIANQGPHPTNTNIKSRL